MTNVDRGRWDSRANPKRLLDYPVLAAVEISKGDLCWKDTDGTVRPASDPTLWTGSLAGTRGKLAEMFAGVAESAHIAGDAVVTTCRINTSGVFDFPVGTPVTFQIGDLVCGSQDGASLFLKAQQVEKVTGTNPLTGNPNRSMAVGRVVRHEVTAAPIVRIEIEGAGRGASPYLAS